MNHRQKKLFACFAFVVCMLIAAHSVGQQHEKTGQVSGQVIDAAGAVIERASVYVRKNTPSAEKIELLTHTDSHGNFVLVLPEGGYDILVTSPGFASALDTIPVFAGKTRKTIWKLKVLPCNFPGVNCDSFR